MATKFPQFNEVFMTTDGPLFNRGQALYFMAISAQVLIGDISGPVYPQPPKFQIELDEEEQ